MVAKYNRDFTLSTCCTLEIFKKSLNIFDVPEIVKRTNLITYDGRDLRIPWMHNELLCLLSEKSIDKFLSGLKINP